MHLKNSNRPSLIIYAKTFPLFTFHFPLKKTAWGSLPTLIQKKYNIE